jgi:hypothetical protein
MGIQRSGLNTFRITETRRTGLHLEIKEFYISEDGSGALRVGLRCVELGLDGR